MGVITILKKQSCADNPLYIFKVYPTSCQYKNNVTYTQHFNDERVSKHKITFQV